MLKLPGSSAHIHPTAPHLTAALSKEDACPPLRTMEINADPIDSPCAYHPNVPNFHIRTVGYTYFLRRRLSLPCRVFKRGFLPSSERKSDRRRLHRFPTRLHDAIAELTLSDRTERIVVTGPHLSAVFQKRAPRPPLGGHILLSPGGMSLIYGFRR